MIRQMLVAAGLVFSICGVANGQNESGQILTGDLKTDLLNGILYDGRDSVVVNDPALRKSPLRAAAYSAVIPGAGEFYSENYWRSAAFFGAEVALWIVYAVYDSRGDRQTADFEAFADQYWSVVRYAEWMETYRLQLNPDAPPCDPIIISNDPALPPWERVNWAALNACEENIGRYAPSGFSHRLPRRPDQQYYELIGKYQQYNAGWEEWNGAPPPEHLLRISDQFRTYRDMSKRADDLYTIARTAGFLLVANHLLSALDAALSAAEFNKSLRIEAHLQPTVRWYGGVEFVPTARAEISF